MSSDRIRSGLRECPFGGKGSPSQFIVTQAQIEVVTSAKSAEAWQLLVELRTRQEVLERWIASQTLSPGLQQGLRGMLNEVEDQLQLLANALSR